LRTPQEICLDRLDHRQHCIDEAADLVEIEPGGQCSGSRHGASYSSASATFANMVSSDRRAAVNSAADAPELFKDWHKSRKARAAHTAPGLGPFAAGISIPVIDGVPAIWGYARWRRSNTRGSSNPTGKARTKPITPAQIVRFRRSSYAFRYSIALEAIGPSPGAVDDRKNSQLVIIDPIGDDVGGSGDHQLASSRNPAGPTEIRMVGKPFDRRPDHRSYAAGGWIVPGYEAANFLKIVKGGCAPDDLHRSLWFFWHRRR
jgi:hypothetical protein